jgi:hypothetical protein
MEWGRKLRLEEGKREDREDTREDIGAYSVIFRRPPTAHIHRLAGVLVKRCYSLKERQYCWRGCHTAYEGAPARRDSEEERGLVLP